MEMATLIVDTHGLASSSQLLFDIQTTRQASSFGRYRPWSLLPIGSVSIQGSAMGFRFITTPLANLSPSEKLVPLEEIRWSPNDRPRPTPHNHVA